MNNTPDFPNINLNKEKKKKEDLHREGEYSLEKVGGSFLFVLALAGIALLVSKNSRVQDNIEYQNKVNSFYIKEIKDTCKTTYDSANYWIEKGWELNFSEPNFKQKEAIYNENQLEYKLNKQ